MSAFNKRLQPKEIFGVPMWAAIACLIALIFGVLSLIIPFIVKLVTIPVAVGALLVAAVAFWFGEDIPFVPLMLRGRFYEVKRVTSETRTDM